MDEPHGFQLRLQIELCVISRTTIYKFACIASCFAHVQWRWDDIILCNSLWDTWLLHHLYKEKCISHQFCMPPYKNIFLQCSVFQIGNRANFGGFLAMTNTLCASTLHTSIATAPSSDSLKRQSDSPWNDGLPGVSSFPRLSHLR